ncbi:MAG: hypothetical protein AAB759_00335 [Patescibacteria group bacterium]
MINPQLSEYVASQLKAGVPKEAVKAALLSNGWAEAEVNEALAAGDGAASVPAQPAASPLAAAVQPAERIVQPVQVMQPVQPAAQTVVAKPAIIKTSDIFQPKNEPVFQPKAGASTSMKPMASPMMIPGAAGMAAPSGMKKYLANGILGFLALVGLGLAVMFYLRMADLKADLDAAKSNPDVISQQVAAMQKERDDLQARVTELGGIQVSAKALEAELSIFKTPENATSTADVNIKGTLRGGDGKTAYSLRTTNDIVLTVKNWKDVKVDAVLKPLVGTIVEIFGNHAPGSRDITVLGVNGKAVE